MAIYRCAWANGDLSFAEASSRSAALKVFAGIGTPDAELVTEVEDLFLSFTPRLVPPGEGSRPLAVWMVERYKGDALPTEKETRRLAEVFAAAEEDDDEDEEEDDDDQEDDDEGGELLDDDEPAPARVAARKR